MARPRLTAIEGQPWEPARRVTFTVEVGPLPAGTAALWQADRSVLVVSDRLQPDDWIWAASDVLRYAFTGRFAHATRDDQEPLRALP